MPKKIKIELGKKTGKCLTVGQLISILKKCPRNRKVKYTTGGSLGFDLVTYVDREGPYCEPFVVIGKLSW